MIRARALTRCAGALTVELPAPGQPEGNTGQSWPLGKYVTANAGRGTGEPGLTRPVVTCQPTGSRA